MQKAVSFVGGYGTVESYLDRIYDEAKVAACMFAFPDFEHDIDLFGEYVLPHMQPRKTH